MMDDNAFVRGGSRQLRRCEYTLSKEEVGRLFAAAKSFNERVLLKTLYYGGLRVSELVSLDVRDLDFSRRVVHVRHGKGGKQRSIPVINSDWWDDLRYFVGRRVEGRLTSLRVRAVQAMVARTGRRAGVAHPDPLAKHINCHLFRHSVARHLKSDGFPAEFVQKFLGHSSISTTMDVYGTLSLDEMGLLAAQRLGDRRLLPDPGVRTG